VRTDADRQSPGSTRHAETRPGSGRVQPRLWGGPAGLMGAGWSVGLPRSPTRTATSGEKYVAGGRPSLVAVRGISRGAGLREFGAGTAAREKIKPRPPFTRLGAGHHCTPHPGPTLSARRGPRPRGPEGGGWGGGMWRGVGGGLRARERSGTPTGVTRGAFCAADKVTARATGIFDNPPHEYERRCRFLGLALGTAPGGPPAAGARDPYTRHSTMHNAADQAFTGGRGGNDSDFFSPGPVPTYRRLGIACRDRPGLGYGPTRKGFGSALPHTDNALDAKTHGGKQITPAWIVARARCTRPTPGPPR